MIKPLKEDESVSRSWALFMEAPEQRKLMPLNIPMVTALSQAMRLAKGVNAMEYKFLYHYRYFKAWVDHGCQLSPILMLKQLFPSPLIYLILMLHLSIFINHTVEIGPLHSTLLPARHRWENKIPTFTQLRQIIDPLRYLNTIYQPRLAIPKYIINASGDDFSYQTTLAFIIANFTA